LYSLKKKIMMKNWKYDEDNKELDRDIELLDERLNGDDEKTN